MALATGTRLEHYEILGAIGAGGMGEVYRARDTKLGRDVAFKVLPEIFAQDADRLARFEREARLLASLNHSNIAQIYGVVDSPGARGIVMELVDGETLQARLRRGPVPVKEALHIARQIAEALEAAHDRGIVHRDLKPGNVMVNADGHAKVLDFGLAKLAEAPDSGLQTSGDLTHSPTVTSPLMMTGVGVILGTAAYMSPEQARGRVADERCDVWAFGCVLYELLTGKQTFTGESVHDLLGAIMHVEPDWRALPAATPPAVQALIKRCLEKDRRRRVHAIGDARIELEEALKTSAPAAIRPVANRRLIAWSAGAAVLALVAIGALLATRSPAPTPGPVVATRFLIEFPPEATLGAAPGDPYISVSPDGRYVAFRALLNGVGRLWLRPISSLSAQPIAGTETIGPNSQPFWSPDSRYLAFFALGKLNKVAVGVGPPQILCDAAGFSGTWNRDDVILFDDGQGSISRVSAAGGTSSIVRAPDKSRNEIGLRWPSFLPDGRSYVYVAAHTDQGSSEIRAGTLDSGNDKSLFPASSRVLYASGHLLFVRNGTLFAQPFDTTNISVVGDAFPAVSEPITSNGIIGYAAFGASTGGTLVYRALGQATDTELTWFDRSGKQLGLAPVMGHIQRPGMAPDQNRVVVEKNDNSGTDIWVLDLSRGTSSRFTYDSAEELFPIFSPDGTQIAFASNRGGKFGVYVKAASGLGSEEPVQTVEGAANLGIADWSPDGKTLIYNVLSSATNWDVWAIPMTGDRKAFPVLHEKYLEVRSRFSPDGHWLLYTSDETGRTEIYVQTFPPSGGKWQVSVNGGVDAYWRRDGKEILFNSTDGQMMAVDVKLGTTFEAGVPHALFKIPGAIVATRFIVTADGQRFLLPLTARAAGRPTLTAVLNWTADIKK